MFLAAAHGLAPAAVAAQTAAALELALFAVEVNGVAQQELVAVLRGSSGEIYVPKAAIVDWRLTLRAPRGITHEGEAFVALHGADGLSFTIDEQTQSLSISAEPKLLQGSNLDLHAYDAGPMTQSGTGGFFNYELLTEHSTGAAHLNGAFEIGIFSHHGFGTNTFVASHDETETRFTRLDSTWTIDDPEQKRSLRLGDSITRGGVAGAPVRFGGVQFGSNFGIEPGFITMPLPALDGAAALPSVVDVYVDNSLRSSTEVAPGTFRVTDIPVVTGGGDVQLIVRDVLGRESIISQSYYTSPKMLRRGLHEHSSAVGFLRRNYARESADYGAMMFSTSHRYGFSNSFTGEAHVEATEKTRAAGVAGALLFSDFALLEASAAASQSDRGTGHVLGFGLERQTRDFSFGGRGEFMSHNYRMIGTPEGWLPPAKIIQLFAGRAFDLGSIGASYTLRDGRSEPDAEIVSANASFRLGQLGSLYISGRTNLRGERDWGAEAGIVIPLGRRTSVSAGTQHRHGRNSVTADFQKSLPAGEGIGYRVSAAAGETERLKGRLSVQTAIGTYHGEAAMLDGKWGARVVASGGVALVDGEVFAARRLSQSFGIVRVGDFEDVRVYADNQLVGRTNDQGMVVVPRLRPFDRNRIEIELADLPIDAAVPAHAKTVRPFDRSGVSVDFDVTMARVAILKILMADGSEPPAGAIVRLNGGEEKFVVAPGGEVYLTGLKRRNHAAVAAGGESCTFDFSFPETEDPQPDFGTFTCRN